MDNLFGLNDEEFENLNNLNDSLKEILKSLQESVMDSIIQDIYDILDIDESTITNEQASKILELMFNQFKAGVDIGKSGIVGDDSKNGGIMRANISLN